MNEKRAIIKKRQIWKIYILQIKNQENKLIVVSYNENQITKHILRHPHQTHSKTRVTGEIEEV